MKKVYFFVLLSSWSLLGFGQQEGQFTQFMNYKLGLNPAYAGSAGGIELAGIVRNQWMGIDGSPQTQLLTFSMPLVNNRVGIGANIVRQSIGVTQQYTLETAYAYRIPVPRGFLGIGLQASVRMLRVDFNQLSGTQPIEQDGAVPANVQSKLVPNFGAGLYYSGEDFYVGVSVPRLLESNIDLSDGDGTISREVQHFYIMGGSRIAVGSNDIELEPQVLIKWLEGAPLDMDLNVTSHFGNTFRLGVSYRLGGSRQGGFGESASLLMGTEIAEKLDIGFAYDLTLSQLRDFNSGSMEVVVRYFLQREAKEVDKPNVDEPRFFY